MKERKWKHITGFEGLYDLRDDGLLYSHTRNTSKRGRFRYGKIVGKGYLSHTLSKNGVTYRKRVNRLVYEVFVGEIPKGYDVHHINHDTKDNRVENLEIIESKQHARMHLEEKPNKMIKATQKPIVQYTVDGVFVAEYQSLNEAERKTKINNISRAAKNKKFYKNGKWHTFKTAGGYIWKYKEAS